MYQKCLYCDSKIDRYSLYHLFIEDDLLCLDCRKELALKIRHYKLEDLDVEYFYDYDSLFKTLMLQYKECYDEALAKVFLYKIDVYIKLKYWDYKIIYVPSSKKKLSERGFNHLKLIFDPLNMKEVIGLNSKEELIQEGKSLIERKKMIGNYYYKGENLKKVLIIDDISTTGSSLLAVKKALDGHYDKIKALVLAKA